jgi:hypothetical protein
MIDSLMPFLRRQANRYKLVMGVKMGRLALMAPVHTQAVSSFIGANFYLRDEEMVNC